MLLFSVLRISKLADPLGGAVSKAPGPGHHQVFPPSEQVFLHADGIVEDHCPAVLPGELLPLLLAGGRVACPGKVRPHFLHDVAELALVGSHLLSAPHRVHNVRVEQERKLRRVNYAKLGG